MTKTKATTLYGYRTEMLSLSEAIRACQAVLQGAIALLYSPQSCQLACLGNDSTLGLADKSEVNLTSDISIFEARIFNPVCELRWLNRMSGKGDAVLLWEPPAPPESLQKIDGFSEPEKIKCESLEQQYLLWGEMSQKSQPECDGWLRLAEARIGKLDVPLERQPEKTQRVYLKTFEYLAAVGQYKNFAVIEERLVKLEVK